MRALGEGGDRGPAVRRFRAKTTRTPPPLAASGYPWDVDAAARELQALWDRKVRFAIESEGQQWVMRFGDYLMPGNRIGSARTFEEAVAWVSEQAQRQAERG